MLFIALAVRQITGSEKIIHILNNFGHSVSHSSVMRHDTALAEKSIRSSTELPETIIPGCSATLVTDNSDFGEESKMQTHITSMIIIQNPDLSQIVPVEHISIERTGRKSMNAPLVNIPEYSLIKKKSPTFLSTTPTSTTRNSFESSLKLDFLYNLLKGFSHGDMLPDWTGFNTALSNPRKCSQITYLPIIDASPTQYSTIYAMLQKSLKILQELGNQYLTIVCDEAIYSKVQQIRWKDQEMKQKLIIRLGAFHAAMSFIGTIGKRFSGSGFQVIRN